MSRTDMPAALRRSTSAIFRMGSLFLGTWSLLGWLSLQLPFQKGPCRFWWISVGRGAAHPSARVRARSAVRNRPERCPDSPGISVRFRPDWVSAFRRNQCPLSAGSRIRKVVKPGRTPPSPDAPMGCTPGGTRLLQRCRRRDSERTDDGRRAFPRARAHDHGAWRCRSPLRGREPVSAHRTAQDHVVDHGLSLRREVVTNSLKLETSAKPEAAFVPCLDYRPQFPRVRPVGHPFQHGAHDCPSPSSPDDRRIEPDAEIEHAGLFAQPGHPCIRADAEEPDEPSARTLDDRVVAEFGGDQLVGVTVVDGPRPLVPPPGGRSCVAVR